MKIKLIKNGFHWYDTMTEEQQLMWVTNVEDSVSLDERIQDVLEDILNEHYDSFRDFLLSSFDWNESNENYYYWQNLSYRN
jgi:hypothetical protein